MTILLLLLGLVAAMGAGVVLTLWRLTRSGPRRLDWSRDSELLLSTGSALETYQPMSRLFAEEDLEFLATQVGFRPALEKRLRRQRKQVFRLYLREVRADFARIYALARAIIPLSQNPAFAGLVTRQAASFYVLLAIIRLRCMLGWYRHVSVETIDLVTAFERLREAARASAAVLTAVPVRAG